MQRHAEALAILALLVPWGILSAFLPMPHVILAFGLLTALAGLLFASASWARLRARALDLDEEAWAIGAALSLGYANVLLFFVRRGESPFQTLCHDCGRLFDARSTFCHGCGSYA